MIDIHSHILPCVDDGSQSIEMSVSMIYSAYRSGVRHIVATPHFYPGIYDNYVTDELERKFRDLRNSIKIERLPVQIYKGMEILGTENLCRDLESKKLWTLNDQQYFLVEFDFDADPEKCSSILSECMGAGYNPVIAHPERYFFVQSNPQIVYNWFINGYGIQVNKGSFLGYFGKRVKKTAESLMRHNLVSCVGSDAHNLTSRTASMEHLVRYLVDHYGKEYANLLIEENPKRILSGRRLVRYEPIPYNNSLERRPAE